MCDWMKHCGEKILLHTKATGQVDGHLCSYPGQSADCRAAHTKVKGKESLHLASHTGKLLSDSDFSDFCYLLCIESRLSESGVA